MLDRYSLELDRSKQLLVDHEKWNRLLVPVRASLFLLACVCLGAAYFQSTRSILLIVSGWFFVVAFFVVVTIHQQIEDRLASYRIDFRLFQRLIARMKRDWKSIPHVKIESKSKLDANELSRLSTADDLDLIGERSLLSWSSLAGTSHGQRELAYQLTHFADEHLVLDRQAIAKELKGQFDLRVRLMRLLWKMGDAPDSLESFSEWAAAPLLLPVAVKWLTRIGPLLVISGGLFWLMSAALSPQFFWFAIALLTSGALINMLLLLRYVGTLHNALVQIDMHRSLEETCHELFQSLTKVSLQSKLLKDITEQLSNPQSDASAIVALSRIRFPMRLAGLRLNPSLYIPFLVLQVTVLWDFRIYSRLEAWRRKYGAYVPKWAEKIGILEVALSASSIADENPRWTYPKLTSNSGQLFEANGMGHPLLSNESRITNDLSIDRSSPLLLVTGSNMSGKSTLMRTVGVNLALARTGAPVCADLFHCPPMEIATSIRVRDSLADGVSFFMAELLRLKLVVDTVAVSRDNDNRMTLVILDEILQGTNSRERQIAVSHVVETLLKKNPMLMVSTHDLLLGEVEPFKSHSQLVHFREHFVEIDGKSQMHFDYQMYPGMAPTTNALKLLQIVGL